MKMLDRWIEGSARDLAKRTARRSVLARLGTLLIGGIFLIIAAFRARSA